MVRSGFVSRLRLALTLGALTFAPAALLPSSAAAYKVPKQCKVPNVVGKPLNAAARRITRAHCLVGVITTQASPVHKNRVLSQDPAPGSPGPIVNLVISTGPPPKGCTVPPVLGEPLSAAERRITRARCQVGTITSQSSPVRAGRVISQDPPAGSPGPSVDLVISSGPAPLPTCRVPGVVGERLAHAKRRLHRANCGVGRIRHRASARRRGRVISQHPHRGERLPAGTKVNLTVSSGRRRAGLNGRPPRSKHRHHERS